MLHKVGVVLKTVVLAVLKHQYAVGLEQPALKDKTRDGGQFGKSVWRVGEDDVKLLSARLDETEHVASYERVVLCPNLGDTLAYERSMVAVGFNAYNLLAAS